MLPRGLAGARQIRLIRPLRPPAVTISSPRHFTRNSQLLLISPHVPRPQLPYLSQPALSRIVPLTGPSYQIARLLSTEAKDKFKREAWLVAKWVAVLYSMMFLASVSWTFVKIGLEERQNPTPDEWRFWTKQELRQARAEEGAVRERKKFVIDWAKFGSHMRDCLARLEDPNYEGKGLKEVGGDGAEKVLIPGVGRAGFDISEKSYEWRTCYFEAVMGCAKAAEYLDSMVLDKTRKAVFPAEMVVGPSNPDPRPVPTFMHKGVAPLEENCEPAFAQPETYYMRVLTGNGFTTQQRMDAAEGYANWLEFKGLHESAEEMYLWGMDIAKAALPLPSDVVIDTQTLVLKEDAGHDASENLLHAARSLAVHRARTGDTASALPILLSILRARRTAPVTDYLDELRNEPPKQRKTDIGAAIDWFRYVFTAPKFAAPPPSGDDPIKRESEKPTCDEGELMLYIGEILFATSPQSQEGVGWTRQAVRIAESKLQGRRYNDPNVTDAEFEEQKMCKQCLLTGVTNWETMLRSLSERQMFSSAREGGRDTGYLEWRGWFGSSGGVKGKTLDEAAVGVVENELRQVEQLRERILREDLERDIAETTPQFGGNSWLGRARGGMK